jgi:hypothetical protein
MSSNYFHTAFNNALEKAVDRVMREKGDRTFFSHDKEDKIEEIAERMVRFFWDESEGKQKDE